MKATGIVRNVDELGRVVLPKELRRVYELNNKDAVEMYLENDMIVIKKYQPMNPCIVTGNVSPDNIKLADGKITISKEGIKTLEEEIRKIRS